MVTRIDSQYRIGFTLGFLQSCSDPSQPFWVELVAEDPDNPGRYSWKQVTPINGDLADTDPLIESGDEVYTAREINETPALKAGVRVLVRFSGYDTTVEDVDKPPVYLFSHARNANFVSWFKIIWWEVLDVNCWRYFGVPVVYDRNGKWLSQAEDDWEGSASENPANVRLYNSIENENGPTGPLGSGENAGDIPGGNYVLPIGIGAVVKAYPVMDCDERVDFIFSAPNNIGGNCMSLTPPFE